MTKITLQDENGTYTIERDTGPTIGDYMDDLVIPVLLAAGFSQEAIDCYLGEEV